MPGNNDGLAVQAAKAARKEPSVAEQIVWKLLRSSRLGFKFRREHPVGPYRLDFFCREAMLAVELDGEQHDPIRDAERDAYLANLGIETLRIPNRRFFGLNQGEFPDEIHEIRRRCEARTGRPAFP